MDSRSDITGLLRRASGGERAALDAVVDLLYEELLAIAHRQVRKEEEGHTLDTSAVAHEAYVQLKAMAAFEWKNRAHFLGVAGRIMRRVLVRYARERRAIKRGGGARPLSVSQASLFTEPQIERILALDELMEGLDRLGPRCRAVVESRVFASMTVEETAAFLEVSPATVKRDWTVARAWLNHALSAERVGPG